MQLGLKGELGLDAIAQAVGRSRATIQTWFDTYPAGLRPTLKAGGADRRLRMKLGWWARQDLNLQGFLQRLLRPPRLPFRHAPDAAQRHS